MINRRLLIKNLLAHNDENTFYDKKRQLNLHLKEGKAKFLKHICALSNSNPGNNSYIVVGVEDEDNAIVGDDFFDDSRIQNLVNAYLNNPPRIQYENVPFPQLPKGRVVGLVTIRSSGTVSSFKKSIHTIPVGAVFFRLGSNSIPTTEVLHQATDNARVVTDIENQSRNSVGHTLDAVIDFINHRHRDIKSYYKVFKDHFVICWAGHHRKVRDQHFYSRVDIELINEQLKLFYSALDDVTISYDQNSFTITEYVPMGLNDKTSYYELERQTIHFYENGFYNITREFLFEPPQYNRRMLHHIYNSNLALLRKLQTDIALNHRERKDLLNLPATLMICYLNDFDQALDVLIEAKPLLKSQDDAAVYQGFKEAMRILRKMKYEPQEK